MTSRMWPIIMEVNENEDCSGDCCRKGAIGFDWVTKILWWRAVVDQLAT